MPTCISMPSDVDQESFAPSTPSDTTEDMPETDAEQQVLRYPEHVRNLPDRFM